MRRLASSAVGLLMATAPLSAAPERAPVEHFSKAGAPFSEAVRVGHILYLSGVIGVGPDGKLAEGIDGQTKQAMDNIGKVLKRAGLGYQNLFHCTAFLSDMKNWPAFNAAYLPYFAAGKLPARSAFGANGLALGALLEIECQADDYH